tara:strand:- start:243 stop:524 length:282 start_codon:yes stop_codon:yes gene_type:complete
MSDDMTAAQMIEELGSVFADAEDPEGYYTTDEWCKAIGLEVSAMRRRLKRAKDAGRLDRMEVKRETIRGHMTKVSAYRVKPLGNADTDEGEST